MQSVDWERVVPEEIPWCEDCGASMEFCSCNEALNYESEEEEV